MIFRKMEIKRGPRGIQGDGGQQGLIGNNDVCSKCENDIEKNTIGSEKLKSDKKKVIVETPVISSNTRGKLL